jgi:kynurenine formamidase
MSAMTTAPATTPEAWWPSPYGPDDEAGALNEITPAGRVRAARLVREGRVYDLAHVLDEKVPAFAGREFRQYLTTSAHQLNRRAAAAGPEGLGRNNVNWVVEYVSAPSQMGTHIDGLNHLQIGDRTYNGHRLVDLVEEYGTNRLGIETLPQVVTRGVLLDIAAARGVERLERGYAITPDDAEAALARQRTTVASGDAVLFHTGWGRWWGVDNDAYVDGEPGPGMALGAWLVDHHVALTGCDTWSFGPVPAEDPTEPFVVPQTLNAKHGLVVLENLRLADLADEKVGEFMFVVSHAKLRGATGAWVAPLAIV